jgi:hypothetical protein
LVFLYQALVSLQPCDICIWYLINLLTNLFIGVYVYTIPVEAGTCNRGSMADELSGILYCLLGFGFLTCSAGLAIFYLEPCYFLVGYSYIVVSLVW